MFPVPTSSWNGSSSRSPRMPRWGCGAHLTSLIRWEPYQTHPQFHRCCNVTVGTAPTGSSSGIGPRTHGAAKLVPKGGRDLRLSPANLSTDLVEEWVLGPKPEDDSLGVCRSLRVITCWEITQDECEFNDVRDVPGASSPQGHPRASARGPMVRPSWCGQVGAA
jgi:hypothetical protein